MYILVIMIAPGKDETVTMAKTVHNSVHKGSAGTILWLASQFFKELILVRKILLMCFQV